VINFIYLAVIPREINKKELSNIYIVYLRDPRKLVENMEVFNSTERTGSFLFPDPLAGLWTRGHTDGHRIMDCLFSGGNYRKQSARGGNELALYGRYNYAPKDKRVVAGDSVYYPLYV